MIPHADVGCSEFPTNMFERHPAVLLVRPYSGAPTTVIFRDVCVGPGIIFRVISGINRELQQIIKGEVGGGSEVGKFSEQSSPLTTQPRS
jgi:hypothetical protein